MKITLMPITFENFKETTYSAKQICATLGINQSTLRRWVANPNIGFPEAYLKVGNYQRWSAVAVNQWISTQV